MYVQDMIEAADGGHYLPRYKPYRWQKHRPRYIERREWHKWPIYAGTDSYV